MRNILLFLLLPFLVKAEPSLGQVEKFKALFLYNFTKHILWPEVYQHGTFNIYILGSSDIIPELEIIASKKNVNGQQMVVKKITTLKSNDICHILYIPGYNSSKLNNLYAQLKDKPTIIITDDFEMASQYGASINYVFKDNSLDYQVFRSNILKNGVQVNPKLFELGIVQ